MSATTEHRDNMDIAEYHLHPAIGKSTLDLIARDPHLVEWQRTAPVDSSKLEAASIGDALHAILLEPDRYAATYATAPECNLRTNDGKAALAAFTAENAGKVILDAGDAKLVTMMRDSIMAHPQARELIEAQGIVERSLFWTDEDAGIRCKCRPDKMLPGAGLLVDVKTTPSIAKFSYSVEDYRYFVQAPWYIDGAERFDSGISEMLFLVVQKTADMGRYPVQVFKLPQDLILYGRQVYRRDLDAYKRFLKGQRQVAELPVHYRFIDHCVEHLEIAT